MAGCDYRLTLGSDKVRAKLLSPGQVTALLAGMENGYREAVMMVLRARQEEIHQALVERTNSVSSATLQDFDWKMKVSYTMCLFTFCLCKSKNIRIRS